MYLLRGWADLSQSKKNKGAFGLPSTLDSKSSFESSSRKFERLTILQVSLESLRKSRRQRQQKRHRIKGFISRTVAVHVRYKSL